MKRTVMILALWVMVLQGCASTPDIHRAAREGDTKKINKLMDKGVFPDLPDQWGQRPLHYASNEGHLEITRILLERGADPNGLDNRDYTPLHHVCDPDILTLLLERGAEINAKNELKITPLHEVLRCQENGRVLASLLIEAGADIKARDMLDLTPLHIAVGYADKSAVELLVESGADINAENVQELTAMDIAIVTGKHGISRILEKKGGKAGKYLSKDDAKAQFERGRLLGTETAVPMEKSFEMDSGFSTIKLELDRDGTAGTHYYAYRGFDTVFGYFFAEPGHTYIVDAQNQVGSQKAFAIIIDKETGQIVGNLR